MRVGVEVFIYLSVSGGFWGGEVTETTRLPGSASCPSVCLVDSCSALSPMFLRALVPPCPSPTPDHCCTAVHPRNGEQTEPTHPPRL
jgi:hypothetical protein